MTDPSDLNVVVVPRRPGELLALPTPSGARRHRDELDELVDDLFGDDDEAGPGWFDAALLVVGLALLAWALVAGGPPLALVAGIGSVVLGVVLPARSAWRAAGRRRVHAARRAVLDRGVPLPTSHPLTARLARAYGRIAGSASADPHAVAVAHAAVLEVATLLEGSEPSSDAETAYVDKRVVAIEALVAALDRPAAAADRAAVAEAREELEAGGVTSTVEQLRSLTSDVEARNGRP